MKSVPVAEQGVVDIRLSQHPNQMLAAGVHARVTALSVEPQQLVLKQIVLKRKHVRHGKMHGAQCILAASPCTACCYSCHSVWRLCL